MRHSALILVSTPLYKKEGGERTSRGYEEDYFGEERTKKPTSKPSGLFSLPPIPLFTYGF
jgi:hypothetical protein